MADSFLGAATAYRCVTTRGSSVAPASLTRCESTALGATQACVAIGRRNKKVEVIRRGWFLPQRLPHHTRRKNASAGGDGAFDDEDEWICVSSEQANQIQAQEEESRDFLIGPPPGDLAQVEAFCRIYRLAEEVQATVMEILRSLSTEQVPRAGLQVAEQVSLLPDSGDVPVVEEVVVAGLARMAALLQEVRKQLFGGNNSMQDDFDTPLSQFRKEMRSCCDALQAALDSLLASRVDGNESVVMCLERLRNVCLDAGFARHEGAPTHADIPNLAAVRLRPARAMRSQDKSDDVTFWRGGQMTERGLEWLVESGFKVFVDLRTADEATSRVQSALEVASVSGKIQLVKMPVRPGGSPTMEQVREFGKLVASSQDKPLFLFSQAGVRRACSMVSRWREWVLRGGLVRELDKRADDTAALETMLVNGIDADLLSKYSEGGHGHAVSSNADGGKSAAEEQLPSDGRITPIGNGSLISNPTAVYGAAQQPFRMVNAFDAQRPGPDVLSKRGMARYMKRKKVESMGNRQASDRNPAHGTVSREILVKPGNIAGPAGKWGLSGPGIPRAGAAADDTMPVLSETPGDDRGGSVVAKSGVNANQDLKKQSAGLIRVAGEEAVLDDVDEPVVVQGDMCASTTGVVRLQSRKKAEMYLVRTDGFSCTRERVKESTLAFTHPSTQQQMLMWKTPPKTVLLLKKLGNELMEETQQVASFLYHQEKMNVMVEPEVHDRFARFPGFGFVQTFYNQDSGELHERVDFVVCLGGDGVILHASNLFRSAVPPVVSFNLGSLGFLTAHPYGNFKQDLRAIVHGNDGMEGVYITLRMRLQCELFRNGKLLPGKVFEVLNEVVVDRGSNPYLCKIECYERNRLITKVQADGVLVATPTGSTAYSTAAGGSMVHPNVPCMLFTPICPHSLSFRPVILPDSALLELRVPSDARNNAWVSFDGKRRQQLCKGDSVRIGMSQHPLPTVNKSDQTDDWFSSLVRCLNWNERLEQKAFVSSS